MPLVENRNGELVPFERLNPGRELYEKEIEQLVWDDLETFTGQSLFRVARQARVENGGVLDILALDEYGQVVVIEIKRDIDRNQLAQCLEYAGWARLTNLDELANLYNGGSGDHQGVEAFFRDWQNFTDTATPLTINPQPRLLLIARDFQDRMRSAIDFLREYSVPIMVIPVTKYKDEDGREFINIEDDYESGLVTVAGIVSQKPGPLRRRVSIMDLLSNGLLEVGERVEFPRPQYKKTYEATIAANGTFILPDNTICTSPTNAAKLSAGSVSVNGWKVWGVPRLDGMKLIELRENYLESCH